MFAATAGLIIENNNPSLNDLKDGVRVITTSTGTPTTWLNGSVDGDPFFCSPLAYPTEQWRVTIETMNGRNAFSVANMGIDTPSAAAAARNMTRIVAAL